MNARPDRMTRHFEEFRARPDSEIEQILARADDLDVHLQAGGSVVPPVRSRHDVEVVFLGALGCRLGMLAGGAGGLVVTLADVSLLVDPGPGALSRLVQLEAAGTFSFASLDGILCTHLHPDHVTDLLPCIEGMLVSGRPTSQQRIVIGNATVVERFRALSPYHFRDVRAEIAAAGGPPLLVGGVRITATPTKHLEEAGRMHSGVGFLLSADAGTVWYSGDTTLYPELVSELECNKSPGAVVIANADASDMARLPGRAEVCHLLTRDIPVLCAAIQPSVLVVQHYDKAYMGSEYRLAQATYAQRDVVRAGLGTLILFAGDGLRLGFCAGTLVAAESLLGTADGDEAAAFAAWSGDRHLAGGMR